MTIAPVAASTNVPSQTSVQRTSSPAPSTTAPADKVTISTTAQQAVRSADRDHDGD